MQNISKYFKYKYQNALMRVLVSIALLCYLLSSIDVVKIGRYLIDADSLALLGAIGFALCAVIIRAYSTMKLMSKSGNPLLRIV
jgi:hypothetical protein